MSTHPSPRCNRAWCVAGVIKVVSGALDRLHYERDPCVKYDSERKLWCYLHGDRSEMDFKDYDTTTSRRDRVKRSLQK